jgi:hypothetical protein
MIHTRQTRQPPPKRTPKNGARQSRTAPAMAKRRATPVNGGKPRRLMRIAAQVVPQIRTRRTSDAHVAERDWIRVRL